MQGPRRLPFILLLATLLLSVCPSPLWAQFTSAIEGTVLDPTNLVVPGATVTLVNPQTGGSQSATTTIAGYYRFPALASGRYTVKVELQGFRTVTLEDIR